MTTETTNNGWWLYIVECADKSLYTGITNNLEQRLVKHNEGTASRYTRSRTPVRLVYHESQPDRSNATRRELAIKHLTRAMKLALINSTARQPRKKR